MIRFVTLSGFLGAGKTTTLIAAARALEERGSRVAVVTNDQGTELVDTRLVRSELDSVAEVTGGCFCCRFDDLVRVVEQLLLGGDIDAVITEAVGSCTDLQATVVRPLRRFYPDRFAVAPLTTVVDPFRLRAFARAAERREPESDLSYLFGRQLLEADVLAVNKVDLIGAREQQQLLATLREGHPEATVVPYSAKTGAGLSDLLAAWSGSPRADVDLDVDYDRYAAAEAQLAWLNQEFIVDSGAGGFSPVDWARTVLTRLAQTVRDAGAVVGHAKLSVDSDGGLTKLSVTGAEDAPTVDRAVSGPVRRARSTLNARIACEPAVLDRAVLAAVASADAVLGTRSRAAEANAFRPAYPRPVHRLGAADA